MRDQTPGGGVDGVAFGAGAYGQFHSPLSAFTPPPLFFLSTTLFFYAKSVLRFYAHNRSHHPPCVQGAFR